MKVDWVSNLDKIFAALTILAEVANLGHIFPPWEGWLVLLFAIATLIAEFIKPGAVVELPAPQKGR